MDIKEFKLIIERRIKNFQHKIHDARVKNYHSEALRDIDITAYSARLEELYSLLSILNKSHEESKQPIK